MKGKNFTSLLILNFLIIFFTSELLIAQGSESWSVRYNGTGSGTDKSNAIIVDNSGNVFVTGSSSGTGLSTEDYVTIRYDSSGAEQWVKRYDGLVGSDIAYAITVDDLGFVYVTGGSMGSGTNYDYLTLKYSPLGDTVWTRKYNGPKNAKDIAYSKLLMTQETF